MSIEIIISLISAIIAGFALRESIIARKVSNSINLKVYEQNIQPRIVFYPGKYNGDYCWFAKNIGNGEALNVLITGSDNKDSWNQNQSVLFPAVEKNQKILLSWNISLDGLVAIYSDSQVKVYTSICIGSKNTITEGNLYDYLKPNIRCWELKDEYFV